MNDKASFKYLAAGITLALLSLTLFLSPIIFRLTIYFFPTNFFFISWICISLALNSLLVLMLIYMIWKLYRKQNSNIEHLSKDSHIIRYLSMLATGTLAQLLPAIYFIADKDDAPGLILIFFIPLCLAALLAFTSNKALSQIKTTRNHF